MKQVALYKISRILLPDINKVNIPKMYESIKKANDKT